MSDSTPRWNYRTWDGGSMLRSAYPNTVEELRCLVMAGRLKPDDEVQQEGADEWVKAATVPGLFADAEPMRLAGPSDRHSTQDDGARHSPLARADSTRLRSCPDCGNSVSLRAASCPHCGSPLQAAAASPDEADSPTRQPHSRQRWPWKVVLLVGGCLIVAVLVCSVMLVRHYWSTPQGENPADTGKTGGNQADTGKEIPTQEREATEKALRSLRQLESLTKTGVTYAEYSSRLLDIKADFDLALDRIPEAKPIRTPLAKAMSAYVEARDYWKHCLANDNFGDSYRWNSAELELEITRLYSDQLPSKNQNLPRELRTKQLMWYLPGGLRRLWDYASSQSKAARLLPPSTVSGHGEATTVRSDPEKIQGAWRVVSYEENGRKDPPGEGEQPEVVFTKTKMKWAGGPEPKEEYRLDPSMTPRWFDVIDRGGGGERLVKAGVYRFVGDDELWIVFGKAAGERPAAFESRPNSPNHVLMVLKRKP